MELLPLVCLCLLSWSGTTSADHHERVVVEEDDDAILKCSFNGVNIETGVFDWKRDKDQKEVFLYAAGYHYNNGRPGQDEQFKGRVSHFQDELKHGNASIKIKKTTMADKGNYTCEFPNNYPSPTFHIKLVVEPVLKDRPVAMEEGSDVILPCSFGVDIRGEQLEWKKDGQIVFAYDAGIRRDGLELFDNRFSLFKDELKRGNASLKIRNTKVADRGDYTCDVSNPTSKIVRVKLDVGAAPEPSVKILEQTKNEALLQCKAHGVPDLEVHWQDSAGNKLTAEEPQVTEGGGRKYITLLTTVTKTDRFYCVATQKNLSHRISADVYVNLPEDKPQTPQSDNTGWIVAGVLSLVLGVVLILLLVLYKRYTKLKHNKGSQQRTESSDNPAESSALT